MTSSEVVVILVSAAYCIIAIFLTIYGAIVDNSVMWGVGDSLLSTAVGAIINKYLN